MVKISKDTEVSIEVSPHDLGREFARMFSDEQAEFFAGVESVTRGWLKASCFQWQALRDDLEDMPNALKEFKAMCEYGYD